MFNFIMSEDALIEEPLFPAGLEYAASLPLVFSRGTTTSAAISRAASAARSRRPMGDTTGSFARGRSRASCSTPERTGMTRTRNTADWSILPLIPIRSQVETNSWRDRLCP
ncbi:MAG: hypothetical protein ACREIA_21085, partial [Opitutaceae bacterium]